MTFKTEDAIKMRDYMAEMQKALVAAEKALEKYNRALEGYNSIKAIISDEEDQIDDAVGAVYAGIVGAKRNV